MLWLVRAHGGNHAQYCPYKICKMSHHISPATIIVRALYTEYRHRTEEFCNAAEVLCPTGSQPQPTLVALVAFATADLPALAHT